MQTGPARDYHAPVMTQSTRVILAVCALLLLRPLTASGQPAASAATPPVKLAIAGVAHGHIGRIVGLIKASTDVELVGVYDNDPALHARDRRTLRAAAVAVLRRPRGDARQDAAAGRGGVWHHGRPSRRRRSRRPRGIHVMMEKPLAVSIADGERIRQAAAAGKIHVIVNYETTWYPSHAAIWDLVKERKAAGEIRKMVAMDGHEGPKEINVQPEFFDWLTDPVRNGAGALFDFGCYGANLMTWLMDNQRPLTVTAITQRIKPGIYPRVDDEATILVEYPEGAGHHPGVVELAVRPQGPRGLRRNRLRDCDRRHLAARAPAEARTSARETPPPRTPDRARRARVLRGHRARHDRRRRACRRSRTTSSSTRSSMPRASRRARARLFGWPADLRALDVAAREGQERRPVRSGRVAAAVLAQGDVAVDERGLLGRELRRPEVLPAEQPIHRPGADAGQEHALRVDPAAFDRPATRR